MNDKYHAEAQRRGEATRQSDPSYHDFHLCASAPLREFFVFLIVTVIAAQPVASAQTLLRWKLKQGDAFVLECEQQTDSQVAFSGKSAATNIEQHSTMGWQVTAANADGFSIRQTTQRVRQRIATPQAAVIEYDSAATGRPTGQARELAESLKPLVGTEFDLVMNPRGIVSSIKPANDLAKAILASMEKRPLPDRTAQNSVEQMLRPSLVVLPEQEVAENATWSIDSDRAVSVKLETNYRLAGVVEREGMKLAEIAIAAKASSKPGEKTSIKSHDQTGTILFSIDDGRVVQIDQTQKLVTERPYRDTTIVVTLNSTEKTTLRSQ